MIFHFIQLAHAQHISFIIEYLPSLIKNSSIAEKKIISRKLNIFHQKNQESLNRNESNIFHQMPHIIH